MSLPNITAVSSLYQTRHRYRLSATLSPTMWTVTLAEADCFNECMAECTAEGGWTQECRAMCRNCDAPPPEYCPADYQECFKTGLRPHCCPNDHECCDMRWTNHFPWGPALACCPPGQRCCSFESQKGLGCYDPRTQQCLPSGIYDCPEGLTLCNGHCCQPGEVCTPQGCSRPENVCHGNRCQPGEVCTDQGCCRQDRVTAEGCCPDGRVKCGEDCCPPDYMCSPSIGCLPKGVSCEGGAACKPGDWCCNGKKCCPDTRRNCIPNPGDALGFKCVR